MKVVGIRQLRQNASAYLRLVRRGETVQIADRGRPVALWIPIPKGGTIARLEAEARLSEVEGDVLDLGLPLRAARGRRTPGQELARIRKHER